MLGITTYLEVVIAEEAQVATGESLDSNLH